MVLSLSPNAMHAECLCRVERLPDVQQIVPVCVVIQPVLHRGRKWGPENLPGEKHDLRAPTRPFDVTAKIVRVGKLMYVIIRSRVSSHFSCLPGQHVVCDMSVILS